jgi:hypothetical protein
VKLFAKESYQRVICYIYIYIRAKNVIMKKGIKLMPTLFSPTARFLRSSAMVLQLWPSCRARVPGLCRVYLESSSSRLSHPENYWLSTRSRARTTGSMITHRHSINAHRTKLSSIASFMGCLAGAIALSHRCSWFS